MQLKFDADIEAFGAEFGAFLDRDLPDDAEALERSGSGSHIAAHHRELYRSAWFERYARTYGGTIPGGTPEIQRNVIAQRVLDLPRN